MHGSFRGAIGIGERAAWGNFPDIIRNGGPGSLSAEPDYHLAKYGDQLAALNLVSRTIKSELVSQVKTIIAGANVNLVPVLAVEQFGSNKIPLAMAEVLGDQLNLAVDISFLQRERINRTGSGANHRLAFNPTFMGNVLAGQKYLILDDTLTMGGTVASLRGYIENRGGHVVGAAVMAAHDSALHIPVKPEMLVAIQSKHGLAMDKYWKETFGYGLEFITQGEAGHLKAAESVDAIRARIAAARNDGIKQLDESRAQATARGTWHASPSDAEINPKPTGPLAQPNGQSSDPIDSRGIPMQFNSYKEITASPEQQAQFFKSVLEGYEKQEKKDSLYNYMSTHLKVGGQPFSQAKHLNALEDASGGWDLEDASPEVRQALAESATAIKQLDKGYSVPEFIVGFRPMIRELHAQGRCKDIDPELSSSKQVAEHQVAVNFRPDA